jgi:hypothetical protein
MPITSADVKSKLTAASWSERDDVACALIKAASAGDIAVWDAEAVLRLLQNLADGYRSTEDTAAIKSLAASTAFQPGTLADAVAIIKGAKPGNPTIQSELKDAVVTRLYAAENKRLSFGEGWAWEGATKGRGQLGQSAYDDVRNTKNFKTEYEAWATRVIIANALKRAVAGGSGGSNIDWSKYAVTIPSTYGAAVSVPELEDFVGTAYLAVKIQGATKAGRNSPDTLKFAVAVYHGMFKMVSEAQTAVGDTVNWPPVEAQLLTKGRKDEVNYVKEVCK